MAPGMAPGGVGVGVLGTAVATVEGVRHEPGAARHRALLAVLAMRAGRSVTTESIIAALWGETPPAGAAGTLQGYVADLRRLLEPRRAPREPARVLVTVPSGYALRVDPGSVDVARFEGAVHDAARELQVIPDPWAPGASPADRPLVAETAQRLDAALAEWRGEPFSDLGGDLAVEAERDRLRALRLEARLLRHTAHLALGGHATVVADLERLARRHPWHERLWGLWAVALTRSGRQAQALACLRELRGSLAEELGIDPGPDVRRLETAIIRQELPPPCPSAPAPEAGSGSWPLVGRGRELALLLGALDLADRGPARLVHLTGEHGTGKTRLTRELETHALERGFRVVRAACSREASGRPLWAWARLVAGLDPLTGDGTECTALDVAERAIATLRSRSRRQPMLVVLEDVQLADAATLRALTHVVAELGDARVALVVTQRPRPDRPGGEMPALLHAFGRNQALHLDLPGLAADDAAALLGAVSDVRLHPRVAADLVRRTDGNPFLVIELARSGDFSPGAVPTSVRAVVAHHLGGLPGDVLELLAAASLLERTFDAGLLASAAGLELPELFEALAPAVSAGLLDEEAEDRYSFRHAIVREVFAGDLTRIARTRWHARFAATAGEVRSA